MMIGDMFDTALKAKVDGLCSNWRPVGRSASACLARWLTKIQPAPTVDVISASLRGPAVCGKNCVYYFYHSWGLG